VLHVQRGVRVTTSGDSPRTNHGSPDTNRGTIFFYAPWSTMEVLTSGGGRVNLSFYTLGILALLSAIPLGVFHGFATGYQFDVRPKKSHRLIWWQGWFMDNYQSIYLCLAALILFFFFVGYRRGEPWPL
jgi:hypothetical protein